MAELIHDTTFTGSAGTAPDPTRFRRVVSGTNSKVELDGSGNLNMTLDRSTASAELWPLDTDGSTDYARPDGEHKFNFTLASNDRIWLYILLTTAGNDVFQLRLDPNLDEWRLQRDGTTLLDDQAFTFTTGTTYWIRQVWRADGTYKFKLWSGLESDEPGGQDTDASWTYSGTGFPVNNATGFRFFLNYYNGSNTYLWGESRLTDPAATGNDPESLSASVSGSDVTLTWPAPTEPGATHTAVFRRTPPTGADFDPSTDTEIGRVTIGTLTYTDVSLSDATYEYQVWPVTVS